MDRQRPRVCGSSTPGRISLAARSIKSRKPAWVVSCSRDNVVTLASVTTIVLRLIQPPLVNVWKPLHAARVVSMSARKMRFISRTSQLETLAREVSSSPGVNPYSDNWKNFAHCAHWHEWNSLGNTRRPPCWGDVTSRAMRDDAGAHV
jgi:hypothetical protein